MSKYAKKKITAKVKPRKRVVKQQSDNINMNSYQKSSRERKKSVSKKQSLSFLKIKGFAVSSVIFVILLGAYLITYILHPVGVLEYASNSLSTIGTGKYPTSLYGGDTLQVEKQDGTYLILSLTNFDVFSNQGKDISSSQHGFLNPVLKTSDLRYLIYDQGGKNLKIYNNNKLLTTKKYENEIISAGIAKNGTYAVATRADGYQSLVTVLNKNEKKLFEWYCVNETVNSLALSDNGNTLVTASLRVDNGKFKTTVNVLQYNSATPIYSYEFDDVVLATEISGNSKCVLSFGDRLLFINLRNGKTVASSSNYDVNIFKRFGNCILTCSSLAANKMETQITLYRFNGDVLHSFNFSSSVDDISYHNGKYFILSDSKIYKLSKDGTVLTSKECSFDINRLVAVSGDSAVGVGYSKIDKYSLAGG